MAQLLLAAAGAAAGAWLAPVGWTMLGMSGAQLGWAAGGMLGSALFAPDQPNVTQEGPRLTDLRVTSADYGTPIPIVYGTARVAGSIIWASDLMETRHEETSGGGGKGGGGGSVTQVSYTYAIHMALALCEGPITAVRRIWANGDLIYDATVDPIAQDARVVQPDNLRLYLGDEAQTPDALIQAAEGAANVPAFRGLAYLVFEDFQLQKYGNRPPSVSVEVDTRQTGVGAPTATQYFVSDTWRTGWAFDPTGGVFWDPVDGGSSYPSFRLVDQSGTVTATVPYTSGVFAPVYYNDDGAGARRIYASSAAGVRVWNAATATYIGNTGKFPYSYLYGVAPDGTIWGESGGAEDTSTNGHLVQVSESGTVLHDTALDAPAPLYKVFVGNDYVWFVANYPTGKSQLKRFNRTTLTIDQTYTETRGGGGCGITYDPGRGSIWYATTSPEGLLVEFDLGTQTVAQEISNVTVPCSVESHVIVIDAANDLVWVKRRNVSDGYDEVLAAYSRSTGVLVAEVNLSTLFPATADIFQMAVANGHLWVHDSGNGYRWRIDFSIVPQCVTVGDVVSDLCLRAGLASADIDVSALTDCIRGYVVGRQTNARAAIEPLQAVYLFDGADSDGKLKFVRRGAAPVATVSDDDLGAGEPQADARPKVEITRTQELDLPREIEMSFSDVTQEYNIGIQYARRLTVRSEGTARLDLPIVLSPDEARRAADTHLAGLWTARDRYKFTTTWARAALEPTDVVTLVADGLARPVRLIKREDNAGWIGWEGCADEAGAYLQQGAGVAALRDVSQAVVAVVPTALALMDLPVLLDSHDGLCLYLAAWSAAPGLWDGAGLYKSIDGGSSYQSIGGFTMPATAGTCQTVLGSGPSCVFDETGTVTVLLDQGTLDSTSTAGVLNGANACVIGEEVLQFRTATLTAPMTYEVSGLLRGRRGTEWAIDGHGADERFVLLRSSSVQRLALDPAEIGAVRKYKAVTVGQAIADVAAQDFTAQGRSLKPYAPVHLAGSRDGSSNLTISWVRRARINAAWRDYVDVPLDEPVEAYDVEIWSAGFAALKRTLHASTPSAAYSAADQTTDFGATQASVAVRVYQISATVGRGYKLEGTI